MAKTIKQWYCETYPDDELGYELNDYATFGELYFALLSGDISVYTILGIADSVIRERVFEHLADRTGQSYEHYYSQWLEQARR